MNQTASQTFGGVGGGRDFFTAQEIKPVLWYQTIIKTTSYNIEFCIITYLMTLF